MRTEDTQNTRIAKRLIRMGKRHAGLLAKEAADAGHPLVGRLPTIAETSLDLAERGFYERWGFPYEEGGSE